MRIDSKYLNVALQNADDRRRTLGVEFDAQKLEEFKTVLDDMAKQRGYDKDKDLLFSDIETIKQHWSDLLVGAARAFSQKDEAFKNNTRVGDYVTEASRYLLALTQKGINGAEFTDDLIKDLHNMTRSASNIINAREKQENYGISATYTYTQQRGKDADVVRRDVKELMTAVSNRKASSMQLGTLYAEWRALNERQAGHGFFWRLFHRSENNRRNTLLKDMKDALVVMTGNMALPKDLEPADVAMEYESRNAREIISENFEKFHLNPEQAFGYEEFIDNPTMLDEFNKSRESMKDDLNLISDVSGKTENKDLSSRIKEEDPSLKKENELFK